MTLHCVCGDGSQGSQRAGKYETLEAACFAEIDPASPIVEELCILSDALKDAIYRQQDCDLTKLIEADLAA